MRAIVLNFLIADAVKQANPSEGTSFILLEHGEGKAQKQKNERHGPNDARPQGDQIENFRGDRII